MEHQDTLATELLHEVKNNARRWFIAFCVMVGLEIATITGFMWYISLPVEEYTIDQEADNNGLNVIGNGDIYNGTTEGNLPQESGEKQERQFKKKKMSHL